MTMGRFMVNDEARSTEVTSARTEGLRAGRDGPAVAGGFLHRCRDVVSAVAASTWIAATLVHLSCGGSGQPTPTGDAADIEVGADWTDPDLLFVDGLDHVGRQDDGQSEDAPTAEAVGPFLDSAGCQGAFGCPCDHASDCDDGWCVPWDQGYVCTETCTETCPPGWEYDPELGIEIARLAVETGSVVLYEYEDGKITVNKLPKVKKPVEEYLMKQGRFSHLTKAQIAEIQEEVDRNFAQLTAGTLS